jgi:hypothetical protein
MNAVTESEFWQWAATRGVDSDPKHFESGVLVFRANSESRFWVVPREPGRRPYFLASLIDLMEDWQSCYVWRPRGSWPDAKRVADLGGNINDEVELLILKGLGLPIGTAAVVEFARAERGALVTLLFATSALDLSPNENTYVVPDHGRQILLTNELGVVHASFTDRRDVDRCVAEMASNGFDLPDKVPHPLLRRPKWMADGDR